MIHTVEGGHGVRDRLYGLLRAHGEWYTRGAWQAVPSDLRTLELGPVTVVHDARDDPTTEATRLAPDLPWADDHFDERVSGVPLNPAPSYAWWPWHSAAHADDHTSAGQFDHTYPERFWPSGVGLRFDLGNLADVVAQLRRDPFTRQAYLPVWFPEDTGAKHGQRVPCSLGYHFIRRRAGLDVQYVLRSCDLTRHAVNDLYLASRLLQYVARGSRGAESFPTVGKVYMTIHNLHVFEPDLWRYQ